MDIHILGTRGEIESTKPYHSKHSGLMIDHMFLFDLGERKFLRLNPKHIFITHQHPDHAFFVRDQENIDRKIFTPENFHRARTFGSYRIKPIPTIHSKKVASQAYLISKGKRRILYTGDMVWINKKYHRLMKDLDLVITEGSFLREEGMIQQDPQTKEIYGHNGIPTLINLFKRFTHKIVLVHFGNWFYANIHHSRKILRDLSREATIIPGYDGLNIRV